MGILGIIALVLASVGVYGVMSYAVSDSAPTRSASAWPWAPRANDIQRMVLKKGALLTLIGMGTRTSSCVRFGERAIQFAFGVKVADPVAFIVLPLVVGGCCHTLASYLPSRRAVPWIH